MSDRFDEPFESLAPGAIYSKVTQWVQRDFDFFVASKCLRDGAAYCEQLSPMACGGWTPGVTTAIACYATYQVIGQDGSVVVGPTTYGDGRGVQHRFDYNDPDHCQSAPGVQSSFVGNPCNTATGAKVHSETDLAGGGGQLGLRRHYDSFSPHASPLGGKWSHDYDRRVLFDAGNPYEVRLRRPGIGNGGLTFFQYNGEWYSYFGFNDSLSGNSTSGWTLTLANGGSEHYNPAGRITREVSASGQETQYTYDTSGRLVGVSAPYGHALTFSYSGELLSAVRDTAGNAVRYGYDTVGNLASVEDADGRVRYYHYEDTRFPQHLTGISDVVNGQFVRYATYAYDTTGKAILSEHAGGQGRISLSYASSSTTVIDAAGNTRTYYFTNNRGARLLYYYSEGAGGYHSYGYDTRNNLSYSTEPGLSRTYTYNATDQRASQSEANGVRVTTYQYLSPAQSLPTVIETPSVYTGQKKRITIAYSASLKPTTITQSGYTPTGQAVSRTVALSYDSAGRVVSIDGPRTDINDVTTLAYYNCATGGACGQPASLTNALGHVTTFDTYDAHGRLLQMTDPNGLRTAYTYDGRGRVRFMVQTPVVGSARTTEYRYDFAGNVLYTAFPDGRTLTYGYDAAEQLSRVTDNLGNYVQYSYDTRGNRSREETRDPDGTLARYLERSFTYRNDVATLNTGGSLTQYTRDAGGRLTKETDPKGTGYVSYTYDSLFRLTGTNQSGLVSSGFQYDIHDRVTRVQHYDVNTYYSYDDLGNLLKETSPDRGPTQYGYDGAGNLTTQTDARGITSAYTYDALNRVTAIDYPGTAEDVAYTYDSAEGCMQGIGRLCRVQDASGETRYAYDGVGNISTQAHTELGIAYTTAYTYDAADRVLSMTYPDGRVLNYTRDALGRVQAVNVTVNNASQNVVSDRRYRADGLLTRQQYANGLEEVREYDLQGRFTTQFVGTADTRVYGYDANGNLTSLQSLPQVGSYTYDTVNRLTQDQITSAPASTQQITYYPTGNRYSATGSGGATEYYSYTYATDRVTWVGNKPLTYDAAGNTTAYGNLTFAYLHAGQLAQVSSGGVLVGAYTYNHQRQRTRKVTGSTATLYHYDLQGNLILETSPDGLPTRAYVWADNTPLAQIERSGTTETVAYLHSDQEGTPRLATNAAGTKVWGWEGRAFGDTPPSGNITVNLRFPGQYFDTESGLYYNWNRYYDPKIGRYITADPMSVAEHVQKWKSMMGMPGQPPLEGNSYVRVANNPLRWNDVTGMDIDVCFYADAAAGFGHVGFGFPGNSGTGGFYPTGNPMSSPGEVKPDEQKEKQCKTVAATPEQDWCVLSCGLKRLNSPGQYKLLGRQCTSFVRDCFTQCGVSAGSYSGPRPLPFYEGLKGK